MRALRFDATLEFVRDAEAPRRSGEALIEVICAGICNTDLEITKGYAGFRGIPGHEFVGRVVECPDSSLLGRRVAGEINAGCNKCDLCLAGDFRHCPDRTVLGIKGRDGAFAEFLSLPTDNLIEVPESITDEAAVFIEPVAAACRVLDQISIQPSNKVAVIGDGKLAQLIIRVIALTGCDLTVIGKHEDKLKLAAAMAARCYRIGDDNLEKGFDIVIEASGGASGLSMALDLVKPQGTVVLKSTHHKRTELDMSRVVVDEITILGSRCGRFRPAIDLLASGAVDVSPLVTRSFPLDEGVAAFELAGSPSSMKILLRIA